MGRQGGNKPGECFYGTIWGTFQKERAATRTAGGRGACDRKKESNTPKGPSNQKEGRRDGSGKGAVFLRNLQRGRGRRSHEGQGGKKRHRDRPPLREKGGETQDRKMKWRRTSAKTAAGGGTSAAKVKLKGALRGSKSLWTQVQPFWGGEERGTGMNVNKK